MRGQAIAVLSGRSSRVAAAIRGKATRAGLRPDQRKNADTCAKAKQWGDSTFCDYWYMKCPCK